jgi:anaphase-promoting complex subunit 1
VEQQQVLNALAHRILSVAVGHGMFTFATGKPSALDHIQIPPLSVSARLPPSSEIVQLDVSSLPSDTFEWPNFHHGVSEGLKIAADSYLINSSWITQPRPDLVPSSYGGFLFALGLSGHLRKLQSWHALDFVRASNDAVTIGFLLGISASYRGSADSWVTRLLSVNIPGLNPPDAKPAHLSPQTHSAALLGIGLTYMGTCRRRFVELTFQEIAAIDYGLGNRYHGGANGEHFYNNREGHSLAAGLALGMITLGTGQRSAGLGDLNLVTGLERYMTGARQSQSRTSLYGHCNLFWKSDSHKVDITAPGATIALGLMYLKTNDAIVAEKLSIPDTGYLLEYVRSDLLLLRTLSKNLIMWDDVTPTKEWVEHQVPQYIKSRLESWERWNNADDDDDSSDYSNEYNLDSSAVESLRHAMYHIIAGACMSVGIKFAGTANEEAYQLLLSYLSYFQKEAAGTGKVFTDICHKFLLTSP